MELVTLAFADYDHPDASGSPDKDQQHPTKRRKINLACEQCRTRKARCDGTKPECGNCKRRKEQCAYKVTKAQHDTTQDYVDSLLAKIAALEDENAKLREQKATNEQDLLTKLLDRVCQQSVGSSPPMVQVSMSGRVLVSKKGSDVDAMGAASSFMVNRSPKGSYFGDSSTTSLMEQVLKAIGEGGSNETSGSTFRASSSLPVGIDNATFEADFAGPENFALFPRPVTDFLLSRYWDKVHSLYPFIHKPTFMQSYERLWRGSAKPAPDNPALGLGESGSAGPLSFTFHCALNAMLILGLQFTQFPAAEKDSLVFQCLQKCKNLLKVDLFNEGSLAVLQMTLLLAHFFQSTASPNKCWNIVGISCRVAQSLGLHVDGIRPSQLPPLERELRIRAWYSCVIFDMIIAMALGRPVMLRRRHSVPLPEPTEDEYLLRGVPQPEHHVSDLLFYRESLKLFVVMREFLAEMYKDGYGQLNHIAKKLDKTAELDGEISRLQTQLPDVLNWEKPIHEDIRGNRSVLEQQRHVLHLRFSAARMGLHRPLFIDYCRTKSVQQPSELSTRFSKCAAVVCIHSSITLVEVVDRYAGTEATCEWWYNVFFIRMAAAILMIAKIQPELVLEVGLSRLEQSWQLCLHVLKTKLPSNDLVRNCIDGLESMYDQVDRYVKMRDARVTSADGLAVFSSETDPINAAFINESAGNPFIDGGFFNTSTDEWGFAIDDYAGTLL
ncbi:uncharacterized protein PV09_04232 [Verruconis gallopava]|uniref:Zn(2)-C6 fungal-type domain-containing protein n=1 Tax=Verruconis gallopava TaxID=253628 RepID=A0A0D2B188_9PEZI|nr:uncharacterized protein PV09_04232 [Verruconis gallopava]KIW05084.1 hypothetical protein PV09_04232 [Verruconis gallopava]